MKKSKTKNINTLTFKRHVLKCLLALSVWNAKIKKHSEETLQNDGSIL